MVLEHGFSSWMSCVNQDELWFLHAQPVSKNEDSMLIPCYPRLEFNAQVIYYPWEGVEIFSPKVGWRIRFEERVKPSFSPLLFGSMAPQLLDGFGYFVSPVNVLFEAAWVSWVLNLLLHLKGRKIYRVTTP